MTEGRLQRREFLATVARVVPAAALAGCTEAPPRAGLGSLDHDVLVALARAILPSEVGPTGPERVATEFEAWLRAYDPLAERPHGYGTDVIERLPSHPGPVWARQLTALDTAARVRFARSFTTLDAARGADVVRSALGTEPIDPMPPPIEARHVAVGLLAYFCASPEAVDLCYRATIGRYLCRPLAASPERPIASEPGDSIP